MSAKKGRRAKVLTVPPAESQKALSFDMDSPNLSSIDRASFLEGLQQNHGNPLHSTAVEEDLNVLEEEQMDKGKAGRKDVPQILKTTAKQRGATVKRKETEKDDGDEKKRSRKSTGEKAKARREKGGKIQKKKGEPEWERAESDADAIPKTSSQPAPKANGLKHLVKKKPAKTRTSAARPSKNQQMSKDKKRTSESSNGESSDHESQEESDSDTPQRSRSRVLSSDEEVDEDMSWKPSPKKARVSGFGVSSKPSSDRSKSRKSSSGSASAEAEKANTDKQRRKILGGQGGTDLEVVLDTFLDFCDQYRDSVESKAVKQSIDSFSSNVKEQLLEKISSYKELRVLKEKMPRAERQVWLLQKEKAELKLRLTDLRRSHAFLRDIRELNQQYLDYRHTHPKEKETYGASSLPALLLETRHIQTTEQQLSRINNQTEKRLQRNGICE